LPSRNAVGAGGRAGARDAYLWRLPATGLCFAIFGLGGLVFGLIVFPILRCLPGSAGVRRSRVRRTLSFAMRSFVAIMRGVGVLTYRFDGIRRLGRPGQLIVANHPSLIDVVFLLGFAPSSSCVVKASLLRNPFTRWPVAAAGYVSNASTDAMIEEGAATLRQGQSVIIFPEGTRTTPGQELRFHRGAAAIAIRSAATVTPVFIRCEPTTLTKNEQWYQIPPSRPHFTLEVGEDIDPAPLRAAATSPVATRALNERLLQIFTTKAAGGF